MTTTGKKPDHVDVHVGRRIVQRRQELEQTQSQLAEACGVSFQQIQKYERAANRVSCSMLHRIAQIQSVAPGWYFEGIELNAAEGQSASMNVRSAADWLQSSEALNFALELMPLGDTAMRQCLGLALGGARLIKGAQAMKDGFADLRDVAEQRELVR